MSLVDRLRARGLEGAPQVASKASAAPAPVAPSSDPSLAPVVSTGGSLMQRMLERTGGELPRNSRAFRVEHRGGVPMTPDLRRILEVPRRAVPLLPDEFLDAFSVEAGCSGCRLCRKGKPRLKRLQALALHEAARAGGLIASLPAGDGKTLVSLLLPEVMGKARPLLLVPPQLRAQLLEHEYAMYARHFRLSMPRDRIIAYSELSQPRGAYLLQNLAPDLMVCDEAHNLRIRASVRTKRYLSYAKINPATAHAHLSGTMTTKSLRDFSHLMELALRGRSPLPLNFGVLEDFCAAIDSGVYSPMPVGAILEICTPEDFAARPADAQLARVSRDLLDRAIARRGLRRKMTETEGVVMGDETEPPCSLEIIAWRPAVPPEVRRALAALEATWAIGDEELEDASRVASVARQLACGFYYVWDWPGGQKDDEWLTARRDWHRAVRETLKHRARPGRDSPLLVARAVERGELPDVEPYYIAWRAVRDRPKPPTKPVWLTHEVIDAAVSEAERLADEGPTILWYSHQAVAERLSDRGCAVFGGGRDSELHDAATSCKAGDFVCCSIKAHGFGKNLQAYSQNLAVSLPSNGKDWEQLLARTHRPGQEADEVRFYAAQHTPALETAFKNSLRDAEYEESLLGKQRLLYARKTGFEWDLNGNCK